MKTSTIFFILIFLVNISTGQEIELRLTQAISVAQKSSLDIFRAKYMFKVKELNHQDFLMELRPNLNLQLTPINYNRSIVEEYNSELMKYEPVEIQRLTSQYNLNLSQKVGLTGGSVNIYSSLLRSQRYGGNYNDNLDFISTPLSISYSQNFSQVNSYKWKAKIEPLKFEQAKLELLEQHESIAVNAVSLFFSMLSAQMNFDIAKLNLSNANTLLDIGEKREKIGAISRDDLLNLELKRINAKINLEQATNQKESARLDFCQFLELPLNTEIKCIAPEKIDLQFVNAELAQSKALKNNPDSHALFQKLLEAQKQEKVAKRNKYNIGLEAGIGFNQNKEEFNQAYKDLLDRQNFRLSVNIPIVDWKENKRQIQRAVLNKELVKKENEKTKEQIMIEVMKKVNDFNIKHREISSAIKADSVSSIAYEATQQLFTLGKASVISINESYKAMYSARNQYLNALRNYWTYYFTLRKLCLYDFQNDTDLSNQISNYLEETN